MSFERILFNGRSQLVDGRWSCALNILFHESPQEKKSTEGRWGEILCYLFVPTICSPEFRPNRPSSRNSNADVFHSSRSTIFYSQTPLECVA
ncbi:hypothetical protein AVEN_97852-1 [Araneus ventricosus]|uniref:Uncharacterized protein n=1 Tax=Araneus ventricosus TaxID=182803 RepID=A0A4Y2QK75_ARAVE|nr:hypothetical protein AVEN_97852-1 [Araneus ventricosus]